MSVFRRLGVAVAVVVCTIVGLAPAASAHAVLLKTEPSPQTTVKQAPDAVRLVFSEPVEATFGAVRVFDVDATRVDTGTIKRAEGNKELIVPVRDLKDGTYTVTWRVVSADGHPVHGGFGFYVGAPSTISAKAVAEDKGAGRVVGWGFGVMRFLWFASLIGLIGAAAVRKWVWTPAARAADMSDSPAGDRFRRGFGRLFPGLWVMLLVAGVLSLGFHVASVSGLSLLSSFKPSSLSEALDTTFGRYWLWEMVITVVLVLPVVGLARRRPLWGAAPGLWLALFWLGAAGLCVVAALNSHARTLDHPALGVVSVAVHLGAVGLWVGGLGALVVLGGMSWRAVERERRPALLRAVVPRFSRIAIAAVVVVVATGTVNAILDLAKVSDLWSTTYGRVVLAKIVLLGLALLLAARHLWVTPRRLANADEADGEARAFQRSSAVELVLLVIAVALASALVALVPGKTLALAANGPISKEQKAGAYTVQLFIDQTAVPNEVHITFVNGQGLAAAEVTNVAASMARDGETPIPLEMRLISSGHFVADAGVMRPGRYRIDVRTGGGVEASTTFNVKLSSKGNQ